MEEPIVPGQMMDSFNWLYLKEKKNFLGLSVLNNCLKDTCRKTKLKSEYKGI